MFRLFSSLRVCFCLAFTFSISFGCLELRGIGNSTEDVYAMEDLSNFALGRVFFFFWFRLLGARDPDVLELRETPIQIRVLAYEAISAYNLLSHYDDVALEFWAREDVANLRRRCNDDDTDSDLFELHKSVAFGYLGCWLIPILLPEVLDDAIEILESNGLDSGICDDGACDGVLGDDPDLDLLATPWGLAYAVFKESEEYILFDGWNQDGSFSREYNRIRFQDFRDYFYWPTRDSY